MLIRFLTASSGRTDVRAIVFGLLALFALPAQAEDLPGLRILNFTADWCPNCQILDPRMDRALERIGPTRSIQRFDLDFTPLRGGGEAERANANADAMRTLEDNQALYLWDYYGGYTGVAVVVASDTGEPMSCLTRALSSQEMELRLLTDLKTVRDTKPGTRFVQGDVPPNCP